MLLVECLSAVGHRAADASHLMTETTRALFTIKVLGDSKKDSQLSFVWSMVPLKGFYRGLRLRFQVFVPPMYPHKAPWVQCLSSVFHPNVHPATGMVYLAILATAWRPVLTIYDILVAVQVRVDTCAMRMPHELTGKNEPYSARWGVARGVWSVERGAWGWRGETSFCCHALPLLCLAALGGNLCVVDPVLIFCSFLFSHHATPRPASPRPWTR